MDRIMYQN